MVRSSLWTVNLNGGCVFKLSKDTIVDLAKVAKQVGFLNIYTCRSEVNIFTAGLEIWMLDFIIRIILFYSIIY